MSSGFTLLEMLMALALVALIGALTVPLLRGSSNDKLFDVAVRDLIGALRTTRLEAIRANTEKTFVIDPNNRSAHIEGSAHRKVLPPSLNIDITATAADLSASSVRLRFFADGSASGGRIRLSNGTRSAVITIDWLTGHVKSASGG
jgi:general secretion pathway protein H